MATTDFLVFATDGGANVISQGDYAALGARTGGFQAGIARSDQFNKVWRQSSVVASALTQVIANRLGVNVVDDGNLAALIAQITAAFGAPPTAEAAGRIFLRPASAIVASEYELNGSLKSRTTDAALWAYAQTSGNLAANDGAWQKGQFSPGDGSTNFRIPDYRGMTPRGWDNGAGVDPGRTIGSYQANQYPAHTHGLGSNGVREVSPPNTNGFSGTNGLGGTLLATNSAGTGTEVRVENVAAMYVITRGV